MRFAFKMDEHFISEEEIRSNTKSVTCLLNQNGIEGALYIVCDQYEIMGEHEYDYVDHLISYIVNDIDVLFRGESFVVSFPDRPLQMTINTMRDMILIAVGKKRTSVPRNEFLRALYDLCRRFFDLMLILFPSGWDEPYVKILRQLPSRYPHILS